VNAFYGKALLQGLDAVQVGAKFPVRPGEGSKDFKTLEVLVGQLVEAGIERGDMVIALGGGVIGDLAGFTAAITLRGVDFIQIPTTLLAQVDSSVGGKTGINLGSGKNLVGAFHQPRLVIIDPDLLVTLDKRELRAGYAEVAKIALIKDEKFFAWLEKNIDSVFDDPAQRLQMIATACRMKADIVTRDEYENSERMLLNLGHTFGHALEVLTGYGDTLLHGEAVSIGIAMAFRFSAELGLCAPQEAERAERHLSGAGLPVLATGLPGVSAKSLLNAMLKDKKMTDGHINLILSRGIGKAFVSHDFTSEKLAAFLQQEMK
jgi:3-dehydroquinate synthase